MNDSQQCTEHEYDCIDNKNHYKIIAIMFNNIKLVSEEERVRQESIMKVFNPIYISFRPQSYLLEKWPGKLFNISGLIFLKNKSISF